MLKRLVFALIFGAVSSESFANSDLAVFSRAESFSASDGAALKSYLNKLRGPKPKEGTYALSRNWIDVGMSWTNWEFSFFHRNDYNLRFHEDTLDFAFRNNNRGWDIPLDKEYQVDVFANQYQATGFKLGHAFHVSKTVKLFVAGAYLHATEAVSGYLGKDEEGGGGVVSKTRVQLPFSDRYIIDLNGNLHTDYYFTDDPLFDRSVEPTTGDGYSIDLGVSWQARENLLFELKVDDALGAIYWGDIAHTIADATSDRFVEDENGVWQANPDFSGWGLEDSFTQDLTLRTRFNVHYDINRFYLGYQYDDMGIGDFHRAIFGYQFSQNWSIKTSVDLVFGSLGVILGAPVGDFHLTFDSTDPNAMHNFGFGWSMQF